MDSNKCNAYGRIYQPVSGVVADSEFIGMGLVIGLLKPCLDFLKRTQSLYTKQVH